MTQQRILHQANKAVLMIQTAPLRNNILINAARMPIFLANPALMDCLCF